MSSPSRQVGATVSLGGWGRYPVEECVAYRPEYAAQLRSLVLDAPETNLIARGLGRSYGDAALNLGNAVILGERFDRMLDLDPDSGILHCEASVSLASIIDHLLPRGFFFPVTPGSKHITVGGAIAADVHGKNHHRSGSMSAWLLDFRLLTASGDVLECSRESHRDVFWATVGGMGLTGIILDARLQLQAVATAYMRADYERAANVDAVLTRMDETDDDYAYSVAWIDCLARGRSLGRSVLLRANHAAAGDLPSRHRSDPHRIQRRWEPTVPFVLPNFILNPMSMRVFNALYYQGHRARRFVTDCNRYFYPLDSLHHWNRVFGPRGVIQYQALLPPESAREGLIELLEVIANAGSGSFLAVLKSMGEPSEGILSFPRPGKTLSLDIPYSGPDLLLLLAKLDRIVLRHGGRVYLAKDSCLQPEVFAQMYPTLPKFQEIKAALDPNQRFSSSLARRLAITAPL